MSNLVTVIVPTFNRANEISACLESIGKQTYKNIEVIIIDDGSTDDTAQVIKNFIDNNTFDIEISYYFKHNEGAPAARNFGLEKCKGKYVVFFDSDDIMLANRIAKQYEKISSGDFDGCACGFVYNSLKGKQYLPFLSGSSFLKDFLTKKLWGSTQSWMYRTRIIQEIGGYDKRLNCYQDNDLTFRFLTKSCKICVVEDLLSIFIDHYDESRITTKSMNNENIYSIKLFHKKIIQYLIKYKQSLLKEEIILFYKEITKKYKEGGDFKRATQSLRSLWEQLIPLKVYHRLSLFFHLYLYITKISIRNKIKQ